MHDLLHDYARELVGAQHSEEQRRAALTSLFDYYLYAAATAMDTLYPTEQQSRPRTPPPASPVPPVSDAVAARAWLDTERPSLIAVAVHSAEHGWPGHAIRLSATRLSATLFRYLTIGAYYAEARTIHACARRTDRDTGDPAAEADALNGLGVADWGQGRYQQATSYLEQALALYRQTANQPGEARTLNNLGIVDCKRGRYQHAASHYQLATALYRQTRERNSEARTLTNLGVTDYRQGRYQQANGHHRHALTLFRETGDRIGEAQALNNLGLAELQQGRYQQAASHLEQALALYRQTGYRTAEPDALASLGVAELRQGHHPEATSHLDQALALCRETGNRTAEAAVLNGLGEILLATGRYQDACIQAAAALAVASQISDKYEQARALHGLGCAHHNLDHPSKAHRHWQRALALYTELGVPEADKVRVMLAVDSGPTHGFPRP